MGILRYKTTLCVIYFLLGHPNFWVNLYFVVFKESATLSKFILKSFPLCCFEDASSSFNSRLSVHLSVDDLKFDLHNFPQLSTIQTILGYSMFEKTFLVLTSTTFRALFDNVDYFFIRGLS